jgi:hypothetical protein
VELDPKIEIALVIPNAHDPGPFAEKEYHRKGGGALSKVHILSEKHKVCTIRERLLMTKLWEF